MNSSAPSLPACEIEDIQAYSNVSPLEMSKFIANEPEEEAGAQFAKVEVEDKRMLEPVGC